MERDDILREILSDEDIMSKYSIKEEDLIKLSTTPPYSKKIIEILSIIINENDNHLNSSMIYKKVKKAHNIG